VTLFHGRSYVQLLILPYFSGEIKFFNDQLSLLEGGGTQDIPEKTNRGAKGFGSTGNT
jgi:dUTPase